MRKLAAIVGALLIVMGLSGCGAVTMQDGVLTVDFAISEETINNIIATSARESVNRGDDVIFDRVTGVDLIEPDIIRVFGDTMTDGNPVSGSYDVRVGAESGALKLSIAAVEVPGVSLDDARLVKANADLAKAFGDQVANERGQGVISGASIQDGQLQLQLSAALEQ